MPSPQRERQQRMSVVLAFDCAVSGLGVALVRDGATLASLREEGREQAARLLPAIAAAMEQADVERRALSMVAVTTGPGSFTGVRVGLAAARGLAMALGIPLAGIATTAVLLAQAGVQERLVLAALDSHLGDWFCAIRAGEEAPFLASTDDLARRLAGRSCLVVGPEAAALAPLLPNAEAMVALPDPVALARLALEGGVEGWQMRNRTEGLPRPLYLRGVNITLPDGARRTVDG
jgi:tRNA threonylcarbamoyladenosine biosynthesis protein TsaB